jgi:hypothetical protein
MVMVGTLAALVLGAGGCSKEDRQDFVQGIGAQVIAEGANDAFADAAIEVDGEMECTSAAADGGIAHITCSGSSVDGQELEITGDLVIENEDIVESRTFRGTADGEEVFSKNCIGEACNLGA